MNLKKIYLYIFLLLLIVNIFSCSNKSSNYYEQILSNIITNTSNGSMNSEGRKTVILNEIVRLSYENQLHQCYLGILRSLNCASEFCCGNTIEHRTTYSL